jgi:hypothetical protein
MQAGLIDDGPIHEAILHADGELLRFGILLAERSGGLGFRLSVSGSFAALRMTTSEVGSKRSG